jgi:uncharacterized caspase-like protein
MLPILRRLAFLLLSFAVVSAATAREPKRVALVIGNAAYSHASLLENPVNDAADVSAALRKLGFDVVEGRDLDEVGMRRTIKLFAERLAGADVGLFFYAGHGLQVGGQNYLVPVDAKLESVAGLDFELVRLDIVHSTMERETKTSVLFLDACRDNPLSRNLARAMGTRSSQIGKGLAVMESGVGTLISFSTQPGNVALDGKGRNSPYTTALIRQITEPREDLSTLLIQVRNDVMAATGDRQIPWEHSALRSKFYFAGAPPPQAPAAAEQSPEQIELAYWASVKDSTDPTVLKGYLDRYPDGVFAGLATARIAHHEQRLKAEAAAREEERRRKEETRTAEEVKHLEDERRAREAALLAEQRAAKEANNMAEAKRVQQKQAAELQTLAAELAKAREEARRAREAAKTAEGQRLAAAKAAEAAAEDARKASQCASGEVLANGKCVAAAKPAKRSVERAQPAGNTGKQEMCRNSAGWVISCSFTQERNDGGAMPVR